MSLTQRLRREGADAFQQKYSLGMFKLCAEAADRIEALEFEVEHERYNVEKTAQEAAKRIKVLEAALKEAGEMWVRKDNRIEALEAALRNARVSIIAIAAECHVAKCEFDMNDKEPPLKAAVARVLVDKALHRIGDIAIKAMDAALAPGQDIDE